MSGLASSPPYRAPLVTRFWFWCGAFDHRLITTRVEAIRAAQVGVLVFLVGVVAAVTFELYATVITGHLTTVAVPFAVLWGFLVFSIDRSILSDPHYGDLTEAERDGDTASTGIAVTAQPPAPTVPGQRDGHTPAEATTAQLSAEPPPAPPSKPRKGRGNGVRLLTYSVRVTMALAVAALMSEALVLLIFQPEIKDVIAQARQARYDTAATHAVDTRRSAINLQIAALQDQVDARQRDVNAANTAVQTAYDRYKDEVGGKVSPNAGQGRLARQEYATYQDRLRDLRTAQDRLAKVRDEVKPQVDQLEQDRGALQNPASTVYRDLRDSDTQWRRATEDLKGPAGWLDQERAFAVYRTEHRGEWAVQGIPWMLRVLFVAVDLVPLSLKLLNGWSVYGRRVREQGAAERYEDRRLHAVRRLNVDAGVDLQAYQTDVNRRVDTETLGRYLRTRVGHLGRSGP